VSEEKTKEKKGEGKKWNGFKEKKIWESAIDMQNQR
jgi:hypothetical protein